MKLLVQLLLNGYKICADTCEVAFDKYIQLDSNPMVMTMVMGIVCGEILLY